LSVPQSSPPVGSEQHVNAQPLSDRPSAQGSDRLHQAETRTLTFLDVDAAGRAYSRPLGGSE
jgi:hypothetical protein